MTGVPELVRRSIGGTNMAETSKLDPTKGYRAVEERLDRTKDPRRRAIL